MKFSIKTTSLATQKPEKRKKYRIMKQENKSIELRNRSSSEDEMRLGFDATGEVKAGRSNKKTLIIAFPSLSCFITIVM